MAATRDSFRKAVAAACAPLGIQADAVTVTAKGIAIPSEGLVVTSELSREGRRTWRATARSFVASAAGTGAEREIVEILFEEPFEREWAVARRIAMTIAAWRVDAAIDAAAA